MSRPGLPMAVRFAARDLRGGLKGFRIMVACLALGVGAIAAIGSFAAELGAGLARDARVLLGGDLDLRLTHRTASAAQLRWLGARGEVSNVTRMRSMATVPGPAQPGGRARALIELKAVDGAYPLIGRVGLAPAMTLAAALARQPGGAFGAVAENALLTRLGLSVGDRIRVGEASLVLKALLEAEPDLASGAFKLGPRVIVSDAALAATGLVRPGSLTRNHTRVLYRPGTDSGTFEEELTRAFPNAGWRVRNVRDGAPRMRRFVDRLGLFFTLIGLTALLVGGIGVGGAVKGWLDAKRETIATLKCLGATGGFVFAVFALEVAAISGLGIALGLAAGAGIAMAASTLAADWAPVTIGVSIHVAPLGIAAAYGIAVAVLFTLAPLARAREVPAAALFRALVDNISYRPRAATVAGLIIAAGAIATLAYATADRPRFALWFIGGAITAFGLFYAVGWMLQRIAGVGARWLTRHRVQAPRLSLSLANIARPGAPTGAVVTAFGVALTVFVALAVIEGNFQRQISEGIPAGAPAYYFIDIQPHQVTGFDAAVGAVSGVGAIRRMPALRGRIIAVNGTPVGEMRIGPGARWAVRGDRGMTYARRTPPGTEIVSGAWWPADYRGPPLVSIDARIARGFGVGLGDSITYNILGRRVTARIANTRHIDWATLGLNFTMIFTPGTLEGAPYTHIATVKATPEAEDALARAVTDRFANVTAVRVRDALQSVARILERIGAAARAMAALALGAGVLVLAGAIAAGRRQRTLDAVILKVTGARKRDLAVAYVIEYGIGGAAAAVPAAVLGTVAAFFVLTQAMHIGWVLLPAPVLGITSVAALAVIGCGFVGTWRALDRRPAEVLRDSRD